MGSLKKHILEQIKVKNRNFVAIIVGKVGTGKSWSAISAAASLDPNFNINKVVFKISDLLDLVNNGNLEFGSCIVFDEAGIDASNRKSYMNKLNKALAFLLQTWRYRKLVLFVTIPDIGFIDAGIRKLFDAVFESQGVIKRENKVRMKVKFIQVNPQSGKAYYKRPRKSIGIIKTKIKKPNIKIIRAYEKKKHLFLTELYSEIKTDIEPIVIENEKSEMMELRKCKVCGNVGDYKRTRNRWECRKCPNVWDHIPPKTAKV